MRWVEGRSRLLAWGSVRWVVLLHTPQHGSETRVSTAGIFTAILAGIVIGALGRLIIPGRQAIGWILTFALGLVGAVFGGFLATGMGFDDVWWQTLIVQVIVAAILVALVSSVIRGQVAKRKSRA